MATRKDTGYDIRQFSIRVQSGNRCLVNAENFPVYQNEITFLFGESGIGKSIITKDYTGCWILKISQSL